MNALHFNQHMSMQYGTKYKLQVSIHTQYIINITTQGANWNNND